MFNTKKTLWKVNPNTRKLSERIRKARLRITEAIQVCAVAASRGRESNLVLVWNQNWARQVDMAGTF